MLPLFAFACHSGPILLNRLRRRKKGNEASEEKRERERACTLSYPQTMTLLRVSEDRPSPRRVGMQPCPNKRSVN